MRSLSILSQALRNCRFKERTAFYPFDSFLNFIPFFIRHCCCKYGLKVNVLRSLSERWRFLRKVMLEELWFFIHSAFSRRTLFLSFWKLCMVKFRWGYFLGFLICVPSMVQQQFSKAESVLFDLALHWKFAWRGVHFRRFFL